MTTDRYVALAFAPARTPWFLDVTRWASDGSVPLEFLKCLTVAEVRSRIESGRPASVLIVDGATPGVDRDLIGRAADHDLPVIIVDSESLRRDWIALGACAVLSDAFERADLLSALQLHTRPITDVVRHPGSASPAPRTKWQGHLITVTGAGGSGRSTVAIALAQALAQDPSAAPLTLVDGARRADMALLHRAESLVPGLQELTEAHRGATLSIDALQSMLRPVPDRGYDLVLGLRQASDWTVLRRRSFQQTLETLRQHRRTVVVDCDPVVEGESETGSPDVEERHLLARTVLLESDVAFVTARPDFVGVHRLVQLLDELERFGIDGSILVPVINRAPKNPRQRAEISRAIHDLRGRDKGGRSTGPSPVFLPTRRGVTEAHRDLVPLPAALCDPLGAVATAVLDRARPTANKSPGPDLIPEPIRPGSMGIAG